MQLLIQLKNKGKIIEDIGDSDEHNTEINDPKNQISVSPVTII